MFPMKRLAHFHDFTTTYYIGASLVFYAALLRESRFVGARRAHAAVFIIAALSIWSTAEVQRRETPGWPELAAETDRARAAIGSETTRLYTPEGRREFLSGVPYSMFLFFPNAIMTDTPGPADYIVTRTAYGERTNLVPQNRSVRVFAR